VGRVVDTAQDMMLTIDGLTDSAKGKLVSDMIDDKVANYTKGFLDITFKD
jgi:hypothetical protein